MFHFHLRKVPTEGGKGGGRSYLKRVEVKKTPRENRKLIIPCRVKESNQGGRGSCTFHKKRGANTEKEKNFLHRGRGALLEGSYGRRGNLCA